MTTRLEILRQLERHEEANIAFALLKEKELDEGEDDEESESNDSVKVPILVESDQTFSPAKSILKQPSLSDSDQKSKLAESSPEELQDSFQASEMSPPELSPPVSQEPPIMTKQQRISKITMSWRASKSVSFSCHEEKAVYRSAAPAITFHKMATSKECVDQECDGLKKKNSSSDKSLIRRLSAESFYLPIKRRNSEDPTLLIRCYSESDVPTFDDEKVVPF